MRRTHLVLSAAVTTLALLLAGCGGATSADRSAAAVEETESSESTELTDLPAEEEEVISVAEPEAIEGAAPTERNTPQPTPTSDELFGTKLCVQNNASKAVTIVSGLGQSSPFDIEPGAQQCSDNFNPLDAKDVKGLLAVNGEELMYVAALNPYVGLASVMLGQPTGYMCTNDNLGRQGMKSTAKDDGVLRYQFERLTPFSLKLQRIEFRLDLSDSANPSSSGTPRRCA